MQQFTYLFNFLVEYFKTSSSQDFSKIPYGIAATGRIKDWIANPESRLPVSCTVFVVEDSIEGKDGIEDSWIFTSKGLRNAAGVAVHLSKLRPNGSNNGKGLTASGPASFAKLYSTLNAVLRRGGIFKNGAVTLHLDYDHPDALEFVETPRAELPWAKRCLNVDENFSSHKNYEEFLLAVKKGDLFLVKKQYEKNGIRVYHNVCLEVIIKHRDTCLLSHVNLGLLKDKEVVEAFKNGMTWLCMLHKNTGVGTDLNYYLPVEQSDQVGLGVLGLSNALAIRDISYEDFVYALSSVVGYTPTLIQSKEVDTSTKAYKYAFVLNEAFQESKVIAEQAGMKRAFVVAPTATCSYNYKDAHGYCTSPEIAPPISTSVERDSSTQDVVYVDYHPMTEIASDVNPAVYLELNAAWQVMMNNTGLAHAISTNWWSDATMNLEDIVSWWIKSPLKSLYYSWRIMPLTQNKSSIINRENTGFEAESCPLDGSCSSCAE